MLYPSQEDQPKAVRAWQKVVNNPWPYGISVFIACFVGIQLTMVSIANGSFEGPDEVQYYKMGLEYSKEIQRQKRQRDLGWHLSHHWGSDQSPARNSAPSGVEPTKVRATANSAGSPMPTRSVDGATATESAPVAILPHQTGGIEWSGQVLDEQGRPIVGRLEMTLKRPVTKKDDLSVVVEQTGGTYRAKLPLHPGTWIVDCHFETDKVRWNHTFRVRVLERG